MTSALGELFLVGWKIGDSHAPLWKIDLADASATLIYDYSADQNSSTRENNIPIDFTEIDSKLFFVANDGLSGNELWTSDGSTIGTKQVLDALAGPEQGDVYNLIDYNGKLFFTALGSINYYSVWNANPTDLSTVEFTIAQQSNCQLINFPQVTDKTLGGPPFAINATATSGLPVTVSATSDRVSINGLSVTLLKAGHVTITANQDGNSTVYPAESVSRTFCVNPSTPEITLTNNSEVTLRSSSEVGNQWYLNGSVINETRATFSPTLFGDYTVKVTIDGCASATSNLVNFIVMGLESPNEIGTLYPNPTSDIVSIKGDIQVYRVVDSIGQEVSIQTTQLAEEIQLNLISLRAGQYYLVFQDKNGFTKSLRLIKK